MTVVLTIGACADDGPREQSAASLATPTASGSAASSYVNPTPGRALAVQEPGMHTALVATETYKDVGGQALALDVYRPGDAAVDTALPVVVLVHGDTPDASPKDFGGFVGWGQLLASQGMAAVVLNHRPDKGFTAAGAAYEDVRDALRHLQANAGRLGVDVSRAAVLGFSAGTPLALRAAYESPPVGVQAVVAYYGPVDRSPYGDESVHWSASGLMTDGSPPLLVVSAGREGNARITQSVALLQDDAGREGLAVRFLTQPEGRHGFDVQGASPQTEEVVRGTLAFLRDELTVGPGGS